LLIFEFEASEVALVGDFFEDFAFVVLAIVHGLVHPDVYKYCALFISTFLMPGMNPVRYRKKILASYTAD
jgi:hypothetical protein